MRTGGTAINEAPDKFTIHLTHHEFVTLRGEIRGRIDCLERALGEPMAPSVAEKIAGNLRHLQALFTAVERAESRRHA